MCFFKRKKEITDYKTIDSLPKKAITVNISLRQSVNICIIDDDRHSIDGYDKLGFTNVDAHGEARDLKDYSKYQIILCDIQGVANELSSSEEGLAFAKQLKKIYPCTEIYLFTGQNVQNFGDPGDISVIKKPKTKAELAEIFDKSIKNLMDPVYVWRKIYRFLTENYISAKDLVIVEENFVQSYMNGTPLSLSNIESKDSRELLTNIAIFVGTLSAAFTKELCSQ